MAFGCKKAEPDVDDRVWCRPIDGPDSNMGDNNVNQSTVAGCFSPVDCCDPQARLDETQNMSVPLRSVF